MSAARQRLTTLLDAVPKEQRKPLFKRHGVSPTAGVKALVAEIELDGGNSIVSLFRRRGVDYREVVEDVASKRGVDVASAADEEQAEQAIVLHVVRSWLKDNPEEAEDVRKILDRLGEEHAGSVFRYLTEGVGTAGLSVLSVVMAQVGRKVVAEVVTAIVAKIIARKMGEQAALNAARALGWAVPVLNVALAAWTVIDIAGPAYRKTVPTVMEIALLRMEYGPEEGEQE